MGFGFIQIPELLRLKISHWTTVGGEKKLSLSGLYFTKSSFLGSSFRQPPSVGPRHLGIMLNWTALPGPFQKLDTRWQQRAFSCWEDTSLNAFFAEAFFYVLGDWKTQQETSSVGRKTSLGGNLRVICMIHKCQHEKSCRYEVSQVCRQFGTHFAVSRGELLEIIIIICLKSDHFWTGFHSCFTVFWCFPVPPSAFVLRVQRILRVPCALRADRGWQTTCGKSREESMGQR